MSKVIKITNFHHACDSTLAVERGATLAQSCFGKSLEVSRAENSDESIYTANMVFTDRKVDVSFFSKISSSQTVNRVANLDSMTLKVPLSETIRAYDEFLYEHYNKPFSWGLWATSTAPETFVWPQDKEVMQAHVDNKSVPFGSDCEYFICKPNDGCQGQGIKIIHGLDNALSILAAEANLKALSPFDGTYVVQPYKSSPALYHGFKFDMRVYVVMVGDGCAMNISGEYMPCRAFLLRSGFARLCSVRYEKVNLKNVSTETMHIANDGVNFKNGVKMSEILRTIEHVFETVATQSEAQNHECGTDGSDRDFVQRSVPEPPSTDHLWQQLSELSSKVICSFQHSLREKHRAAVISGSTEQTLTHSPPSMCLECSAPSDLIERSLCSSRCECCTIGNGGCPGTSPLAEVPVCDNVKTPAAALPPAYIHSNSYQLLGLDVMLDADGKMWLLECNAKPCMDWEKEHVEYTVGPEVNSEVMAISLAIGTSLNDPAEMQALVNHDMIKARTIELNTTVRMDELADSLLKMV
jgi:hypothetical protein